MVGGCFMPRSPAACAVPVSQHCRQIVCCSYSGSRRYVFVQSNELLKLNFHPSSLLTIGDMLAFTRKLSDRSPAASAAAIGRVDTNAPNAENPPSATEQLALRGSIMSRVPQR